MLNPPQTTNLTFIFCMPDSSLQTGTLNPVSPKPHINSKPDACTKAPADEACRYPLLPPWNRGGGKLGGGGGGTASGLSAAVR